MAEPFRFTCQGCPWRSDDLNAAHEHTAAPGHRVRDNRPRKPCLRFHERSSWTACGEAVSPEVQAVLVDDTSRYGAERYCRGCVANLPESSQAEVVSLAEARRELDATMARVAALTQRVQLLEAGLKQGMPGLKGRAADSLAGLHDVAAMLGHVRGSLYAMALAVARAERHPEEASHG
jgi:hypothetical protein